MAIAANDPGFEPYLGLEEEVIEDIVAMIFWSANGAFHEERQDPRFPKGRQRISHLVGPQLAPLASLLDGRTWGGELLVLESHITPPRIARTTTVAGHFRADKIWP